MMIHISAGKPINVLVTGASGFIGSHVAAHLAKEGFHVVGVYRRQVGMAEPLIDTIDLIKRDLVRPLFVPGPIDAIVHCAATSPEPGVSEATIALDNISATLNVIEFAKAAGVTGLVFCSSMSVYGEPTSGIVDENTDKINPDAYGCTKLIGECLLKERSDRLPGLALRLPGVIGKGAKRNWLSRIVEQLKKGETIKVWNHLGVFNNAVHVNELSTLIAGAITKGWEGFHAVTLGSSGHISISEVITRLAAGLGLPFHYETARLALKPPFTICSDYAIECWGYKPAEIGEILDRYAAEMRS